MSWQEKGACFDSDTTVFFPIRAEMTKGEYNEAVAKAKAICANCVVRLECLEEGKESDYGIWGGEVK